MVVPVCDCVDSLATLTSAIEQVKPPVLLEVAEMPKTLLLSQVTVLSRKVIIGIALFTIKVMDDIADLQKPSADWVINIVVVPTPVVTIVLLETLAIKESETV